MNIRIDTHPDFLALSRVSQVVANVKLFYEIGHKLLHSARRSLLRLPVDPALIYLETESMSSLADRMKIGPPNPLSRNSS
jgi:hypothetical protein